MLVDVQAGPVVASSDVENSNIRTPVPFAFCSSESPFRAESSPPHPSPQPTHRLDEASRTANLVTTTHMLVTNLLLPNIQALCGRFTQATLQLPIHHFFFTEADDLSEDQAAATELETKVMMNMIASFENELFAGVHIEASSHVQPINKNGCVVTVVVSVVGGVGGVSSSPSAWWQWSCPGGEACRSLTATSRAL